MAAKLKRPPPLRRTSDKALRQTRGELKGWFRDLEKWGVRVKRDIINLEKCVKRNHSEFKPGKPPKGGDPGDPPRGPW